MKRLLIAVELFLAGGLASLLLVHYRLASTLDVLLTPAAQAERLNVLDKMLGYNFGYAVALVVVGLLILVTMAARPRLKPSSPA